MSTPPGWYPHPEMANTRRYWDGAHWTDHIAPDAEPPEPRRSADPRFIRRLATVIGLLFLVPTLVVTFTQPTAQGVECGTWLDPRFTDLEVSMLKADNALNGGGAFGTITIEAVADECNDALNGRRTLAFVLIGMGIVARYGIPRAFGAPAPRRYNDTPVKTYHPLAAFPLDVKRAAVVGGGLIGAALLVALVISALT